MAELTQARALELFEYRAGKLYWRISAKGVSAGSRAGYLRPSGYRFVRIDYVPHREHRVIYLMHHGVLPKLIDHVNGDRQDNRIENLRSADICQNAFNSKTAINNKSGVKGVSWHKKAGKWVVQLITRKRHRYLGLYDDLELAELVAMEARNKYHGEFARHG